MFYGFRIYCCVKRAIVRTYGFGIYAGFRVLEGFVYEDYLDPQSR